MNEDWNIDDLLGNLNKERKPNTSKRKGSRGERELIKELSSRFSEHQFARVVGSGNRWSQVNLSEEVKEIFTGDIICPPNFRFVVESKFGYDIDLCSTFEKGNKELDEFLEQAERDSKRIKKEPLLCWKKSRLPWLAFLKTHLVKQERFIYRLHYREWVGVSLAELLQLKDDFWFRDHTQK